MISRNYAKVPIQKSMIDKEYQHNITYMYDPKYSFDPKFQLYILCVCKHLVERSRTFECLMDMCTYYSVYCISGPCIERFCLFIRKKCTEPYFLHSNTKSWALSFKLKSMLSTPLQEGSVVQPRRNEEGWSQPP